MQNSSGNTSPYLIFQNHSLTYGTKSLPNSPTYQPLSREDFQQLDEHPSISKVSVQVCDPAGHSGEVGIDPLGEGLLLHSFTLICKQKRAHLTINYSMPAGEMCYQGHKTPAKGRTGKLNSE